MVNSVLYCQERIRGLQGAAAGFMCPGTPTGARRTPAQTGLGVGGG